MKIKMEEEKLHPEGVSARDDVVTKQDVYYAYKFFLGREPETLAIYESNINTGDLVSILEDIIRSQEFKENPRLKNLISVRRKPLGYSEEKDDEISTTDTRKILVVSGCQGGTLAGCIQAFTGNPNVLGIYSGSVSDDTLVDELVSSKYSKEFDSADLILTQKKEIYNFCLGKPGLDKKVRLLPLIEYEAFHPDQCYLVNKNSGVTVVGPTGEYNSLISLLGFLLGIGVDRTCELFNRKVYKILQYDDLLASARDRLEEQELLTGYPVSFMAEHWRQNGRWMRTINHPKKFVLADIAAEAMKREGIEIREERSSFVPDELSYQTDWPSYGSINLGESFHFKLPRVFCGSQNNILFLDKKNFVEKSFSAFSGLTVDNIEATQLGRVIDIRSAMFSISTVL